MNEKMVLLNIDLADVGTFFVVLWPLMALLLSILCWCSIGTPPKRSKEPGSKGLLQTWSTPAYHAVLSLLVRWTGGKHRGLQAWDVTPKTVRMCSFGVLFLSLREPADVSVGAADVSARASRCSTPPVCLYFMKGNYLLNLPELFTNFPELFTKISGTIY